MKILESLLVALLFLHGSVAFKVMCVYSNWSQYRPVGGTFVPEDVDPTLCTHLVYVYAKIKGNRLAPVEWNDDGTKWSDGMYQKVNKLKDMNPELKTLLGVGGWMMGGKDFSRLAAGRGSRRMFARTAVKFLRDRDFDGLTVDWQYPTKRGGRPKDKENYSLLLKEIRQAFDDDSKKSGLPPLLLTVGVSASREVIDNAYEVANVSKYVDLINVMAYDLHGPWDNYTGHPSQLYAREEEFRPSTEVNVDAIMRHWISLVPDRQKLIMGVSTYGRSFTLRKARHHEYNVRTTGPGNAGEFTQQPGMLAYYERCSLFLDAPRVWDPVSKVAYWYNGDQWTAGEDIESIRAKVNWTRTYQIGGMSLWSLDTDDFGDVCYTGNFGLLSTLNTEINQPLDPNAKLPILPPLLKTKDTQQTIVKDILPKELATTDAPVSDQTVSASKAPNIKKPRKVERISAKEDTKAPPNTTAAKKTTVQSKLETLLKPKQQVVRALETSPRTNPPKPGTKATRPQKPNRCRPRIIIDKKGRKRMVRCRRPPKKKKSVPKQKIVQPQNNVNENTIDQAKLKGKTKPGMKNGKVHDQIKADVNEAAKNKNNMKAVSQQGNNQDTIKQDQNTDGNIAADTVSKKENMSVAPVNKASAPIKGKPTRKPVKKRIRRPNGQARPRQQKQQIAKTTAKHLTTIKTVTIPSTPQPIKTKENTNVKPTIKGQEKTEGASKNNVNKETVMKENKSGNVSDNKPRRRKRPRLTKAQIQKRRLWLRQRRLRNKQRANDKTKQGSGKA